MLLGFETLLYLLLDLGTSPEMTDLRFDTRHMKKPYSLVVIARLAAGFST